MVTTMVLQKISELGQATMKMVQFIGCRLFCFSCIGLASYTANANVEIKPTLDVSYLNVVDSERKERDFSGHQAMTVTPALNLDREGRLWTSQLKADHTEVIQVGNEQDDVAYSNIEFNNQLSFLDDRIMLSNGISRQHRNIDTTLGVGADPIFGFAEFIEVDTVTNLLKFKNATKSTWQNSLSLSQSKTSFDEMKLEDTDTQVTNLNQGKSHSAAVSIMYSQRPNQMRGGLQLSFARNERQTRGNQDNISGNLNLGIPLYSDFDFVISATRVESRLENSVLDDSDLASESYGAGLAWRFGARSNIELTYNQETRGQKDTFAGYRLNFYPSNRTSLVYERSNRFYGESHSLDLSHSAKRWRFTINYNENLGSQTRINRTEVSLGNFLCPDGVVDVEECTLLTERPDIIEEGFFETEVTRPTFTLVEEISLAKTLRSSIAYQFRKATLDISVSKGESEYLERVELTDAKRTTESQSVSYTHNMTRRNSFSVSATKSKSRSSSLISGDRDSFNVSARFIRKMSRKATGTISLIKFENKSTTGNLDRKDTRVEVNYSYSF